MDEQRLGKLEERLFKNTEDIGSVVGQVEKLAVMQENAERRHEDNMNIVKQAVEQIQKLNERVGGIIGLEKDVASIKESAADLKAELRIVRHDMKNMENGMNAIPLLKEDLVNTKSVLAEYKAEMNIQANEIAALKTWKEQITGGTMAIKSTASIWKYLFGGAVGMIIMYYLETRIGIKLQ